MSRLVLVINLFSLHRSDSLCKKDVVKEILEDMHAENCNALWGLESGGCITANNVRFLTIVDSTAFIRLPYLSKVNQYQAV